MVLLDNVVQFANMNNFTNAMAQENRQDDYCNDYDDNKQNNIQQK